MALRSRPPGNFITTSLETNFLFRSVRRAAGTLPFFRGSVEIDVKAQQRFRLDTVKIRRRVVEFCDRADADDGDADGLDEVDRFADRFAGAVDVVDDDRWIHRIVL